MNCKNVRYFVINIIQNVYLRLNPALVGKGSHFNPLSIKLQKQSSGSETKQLGKRIKQLRASEESKGW